MKTKLLTMCVILTILSLGCKKDEVSKNEKIEASSITFTDCNAESKSIDVNTTSVRVIGQENGNLIIKLSNTEFCCSTSSISLNTKVNDCKINIEIIDNGPLSYCFCPHDIEFTLSALEMKNYELTLIESENAYSRDTFLIKFKYSEQLDTAFIGITPNTLIKNGFVTFGANYHIINCISIVSIYVDDEKIGTLTNPTDTIENCGEESNITKELPVGNHTYKIEIRPETGTGCSKDINGTFTVLENECEKIFIDYLEVFNTNSVKSTGILKGTIGLYEGNCMPSQGMPPCEPSPISTTVAITQPSEDSNIDLLVDSVITSKNNHIFIAINANLCMCACTL